MREKLIQYVELLFAGIPDCEDMKQEILQNTLDRYDDLISEGKVPEAAYRLAIGGIGDISELLTGSSKKEPASAPAPMAPTVEPEKSEEAKKRFRAIAIGLYIVSLIPLIAFSEVGLDTIGLCITLIIVSVATVILIVCGKKEKEPDVCPEKEEEESPLAKSISGFVWAVGLALYLVISFATGAWHITWVIFPILGALDHMLRILISAKDPAQPLSVPEKNSAMKKAVSGGIWAVSLALYFLVSFATHAWFITWILFPLTGAVQGLVHAIWDLKEAIQHEN